MAIGVLRVLGGVLLGAICLGGAFTLYCCCYVSANNAGDRSNKKRNVKDSKCDMCDKPRYK